MLSPDPSPYKTIRCEGRSGWLSGVTSLSISGPDAAAFLQAQTMNDVRALAAGHWHWNGWLNPKGRVIALFALLHVDVDQFIALLPDIPAGELAPLLQRFVFRSKVKLVAEPALLAFGEIDPVGQQDVPRDLIHGSIGSGLSIDLSGEQVRRRLTIEHQQSALPPTDAAFEEEWRALDFVHGLPRLDATQRELWTPQMLSLDRLRAFSLAKGCYPGQEIVARTHYLGQAKRALALVKGSGVVVGGALTGPGDVGLGTVISASENGLLGLAVVQAEQRLGPARLAATDVELSGFMGGLQRPL